MEGLAFAIEAIEPDDEEAVGELIRRNLDVFDEQTPVLISTFRRLQSLHKTYSSLGSRLLVVKTQNLPRVLVACLGIGPLHGLPVSEGLGELRDLVVDQNYRGRGLGRFILDHGIRIAKELGYQRLYLETTDAMTAAQNLFQRRGFRPVTNQNPLAEHSGVKASETSGNVLPCYYLLEKL